MTSSMSSNAILAKARAMYGRRLTEDDYSQLMDCHTVGEVASYLKNRTSYSEALINVNENDVHRGQLEPILRQGIYTDIFRLSRYAKDKSMSFMEFVISEMEIEQIIMCLTHINMGKAEEFVYKLPLSLDKYTKISFKKLAAVRSYDDMFEALAGSRYVAVLKKNRPAENERINIALIESELYNMNYAFVIGAMDSAKDAGDKNELKNLLSSLLDFRNASRILRLKKYFGMSAAEIKPLLIPYGRLSQRTIDELCAASSLTEAEGLINSTYLGKAISKLDRDDRDQMADAMIHDYCRHHLRLSPNPTIVMISYVYLKEIELNNVVNIIEATRYGLSPEEKSLLLVR